MKRGVSTKKPVKAIIFDIGGVLEISRQPEKIIKDKNLRCLPPSCKHRHKGVHEFLLSKLKIPLDQYLDAIDTTYAMSIEGKLSEKEVEQILAKNLRISQKKLTQLYFNAYRRNFKTNKQLYDLASKLKKKDYKIAILSDQWHLSKKALVPKKLMKKFDSVVISCDVGMRKPNKDIYKLSLKQLKVKPSQAIFIDNQKWNTSVAKQLKMKTILYKNNKQLSKQLSKQGVKW